MDKLTETLQANQTTQTVIARVGFKGYNDKIQTKDGRYMPFVYLELGDLFLLLIAYSETLINDGLIEGSIVKADLIDVKHLADEYWQCKMESLEVLYRN